MHGQAGYTCSKPSRRRPHSTAGEGGGRFGFARSKKAEVLVKLLETSPEERRPKGALTTAGPRFISPPWMSVPKELGWEIALCIVVFLSFFAPLSQLLSEEKSQSPSVLDCSLLCRIFA